ncbi:MAG: fibronectin type III domain-containing protein [Mycetocola sp.]
MSVFSVAALTLTALLALGSPVVPQADSVTAQDSGASTLSAPSDTPVSTEQAPVSTEQAPVSTEQTPVSTEQTPASTEQAPVSTEQTPSDATSPAPVVETGETTTSTARIATDTLATTTAVPGLSAAAQTAAINTVLADTNAERKKEGLAPLTLNPKLTSVAQNWSETMLSTGNFAHNPSHSSQIPAGWIRAGENIAYGYQADAVTDAWMASPGHRTIILGSYTDIGIGIAVNPRNGWPYFTQNFANYPPISISAPRSHTVTATDITLTTKWAAPATVSGGSHSGYTVRVLTGSTVVSQTTLGKTATSFTARGLTPKKSYTVEVAATLQSRENKTVTSTASKKSITTTASTAHVAKVAAPKFRSSPAELTINKVRLDWTVASSTGVRGTDIVELYRGGTRILNTQANGSLVIQKLTPNTSYTAKVTARVTSRDGKATAKATTSYSFKTKADVAKASAPRSAAITKKSATALTVSYAKPQSVSGSITKYTLALRSSSGTITKTTTGTSYRFTGLREGTKYTATIVATVANPSKTKTATSPKSTISSSTPWSARSQVSSSAPRALKASKVSATKATVSWTKPAKVTGVVTRYSVTVSAPGTKTRTVSTTKTSQALTGLAKGKSYSVTVTAHVKSANGKRTTTAKSGVLKVATPKK